MIRTAPSPLLPMPPLLITTSWDDGHPADLRIAELLDRHRLTGTFYIPRSIESGVMPVTRVRELAGRFEVGAHTLNHVFLADTDLQTAKSEIEGSKKWVEDVTGHPCPMFCPPAGRYCRDHLPIFESAGYLAIRSVEFMSLDRPRRRGGGLLEMPTTLQAFDQPPKAFVKNALKRRSPGNLWRYVAHGRAAGDWTVLAKRLLARARSIGGVFHLWGHSWEVEQTGGWGRLEQVLKLLGEVSAAANAPCLTNGELCRRARQGGDGDIIGNGDVGRHPERVVRSPS